jgi:hypothetical protein
LSELSREEEYVSVAECVGNLGDRQFSFGEQQLSSGDSAPDDVMDRAVADLGREKPREMRGGKASDLRETRNGPGFGRFLLDRLDTALDSGIDSRPWGGFGSKCKKYLPDCEGCSARLIEMVDTVAPNCAPDHLLEEDAVGELEMLIRMRESSGSVHGSDQFEVAGEYRQWMRSVVPTCWRAAWTEEKTASGRDLVPTVT